MPFGDGLSYSLRENSSDDCLGNMWPAKLLSFAGWVLLGGLLGWGCGEGSVRSTVDSTGPAVEYGGGQTAAYTHYRADGNRFADGWGTLPEATPLDIPLDGVAEWVIAASTGRSSIWVAVLSDGRVQAFRVADRTYAPIGVGDDQMSVGMPPALRIEGGLRARLLGGDTSTAPFSHPVILPDGRIAFIDYRGELVVVSGQGEDRLPVDALPDARLLVDEAGRLAFYNRPTARYAHGVLGDIIEAGGFVIVSTSGKPRIESQLEFQSPLVAEGLAPLWVDWDGDGVREIVVTLSEERSGARVAVFSEEGVELAVGGPVGRGFSWRHVIACVDFTNNNDRELVAVRTPHIGGVVEFYALEGKAMEIVAQLSGFTSHVAGTRNLDMALAGDFDGDGSLEVLLPTQERTHLAAIGRSARGAQRLWQVDLGGQMTTNLTAAVLVDGRMLVGAAHAGQRLRIWGP